MSEGTLDERMRHATTVVADINERSARVWAALLEAAANDPEVEAWRLEGTTNRRTDAGRSLERIFGTMPDPLELDVLWALYSPETYLALIEDRGWSRADYEAMIRTMTARILAIDLQAPAPPPAASRQGVRSRFG